MSIKCEEHNHVCVMNVAGELAGETAEAARKAVEDHIDNRQIVDFVLDLEKTGFIDSEGLSTLLWMKKRCEEHFGQVKLASLDDNCRKILEITRLEHRFECCPDLSAALRNMR